MGRNAYCMRFRPVPSEGESFMASKQKILIVDDDNNIAELISLYLTKECYDTKIVNDGEEAVREFHSFQPNLILLDLMLPGMDGYQVCREIRHDSDVPIIMLSAKGEVFDKVLGLELGADDYIIKPARCPCESSAAEISAITHDPGVRDRRKMCRVPGSYHQPDELFRHLPGPHRRYAAEGTGASLLPCFLTKPGLYARTAPRPYLGL